MGVKFSSVVFLILAVFIVKISLENFGEANASDTNQIKHEKVELNHKPIKVTQHK